MPRLGIWLPLLLAAICLGLGYGYGRARLERNALRASHDAQAAMEQQDKRELAELRKKVQSLQAAETARVKRNAEVRKARAALEAGRTEGAPAGPAVIRYSDIIKDHPEFAALRDKETRRNITRQYGDAIASLNLPPAEAAQLKSLLVERQLSEQDAREAAQAAGLRPGTPEFNRATSQAYQEVQQQIAGLIGKEGVNALQQSQMMAGYKNMVAYTYAPDFADAGLPLSAEQQTSLAQLLNPMESLRNNPEARTPGFRQPDPGTWLSPADQQTLSRAAQTMNPAQVDILKSELADENHRNAIMQPYFQAARNSGGGGAIRIMQ